MTTLSNVIVEAKPGFACGKEDENGVFQFRMHNVSRDSRLDLERRRRVPRTAVRNVDQFRLRPGDVLFNATNSPDNVGKSILVPQLDEPAVFSNHFIRLRASKSQLYPAYLWRWLQWSYQRRIFEGICKRWVNQATVARESLLNLDIPLPPLDEQRRIAAILDKADALRALHSQVDVHFGSLTRELFRQMFGDPSTNDRGWPEVRLSDIVRSIDSGHSPVCEVRAATESEWAVLKLGAVSYGTFRPEDNKAYIGEPPRGAVEVEPGDLLFSRKNTKELVGAVAIAYDAPPRRLLPDLIFRLNLDPNFVTPEFLHALLSDPAKRPSIVAMASGSASSMSNISKGRLMTLRVGLPPLEKQEEFSRALRASNGQRAQNAKARGAFDELFSSLQAQAFAGEL